MLGIFRPVVHGMILFMEFRSEFHGIGERPLVSVVGLNSYQINSLGIFSGNDPVKNCRK